MRKFLFLRWVLLPMALSMALLTTACGGDEPEPPEPIETPTPDEPTPDEPTPDEPTPDEPTPDVSKYYTPEESEFYGMWRVCWEKIDWYRCFNNKWSYTESDIYDGPTSWHSWYGWPYYLGILKDTRGYLYSIWESLAIGDFDNLVSLVEQKGSIKYSDFEVILTDGVLSGNSASYIEWHPNVKNDVDMLLFFSASGNVWERWKITQFDGESFTASPAHYDFPKREDGSNYCFTTYKFVRYVPQTNY